ncbi:CPCC family cysteine-rich protein [Sporanaerobium hydrogeniformans]|uniref:CPCC family cysteine-rich protein n=1 Tax=Sporanaerobium hydrogeniformans TaxID=3072179 RepID=UPI0026848850|nr:CPCC family cysteine-rich protein [Sporanaerobium hydrogeniformans]
MEYKYLPKVTKDSKIATTYEILDEVVGVYPCLCCGYKTLPVPKEDAIAYICPVCFWENDVFISSDDNSSDENSGMSLNEAKQNFKMYRACKKEYLSNVREPFESEMPK